MEGLTREELRQMMAEVVREELADIRPQIRRKSDDTLSFEEALSYLKSRHCVGSKSALYKMSDRVIPYLIVGRRRVYYMRDLKQYADKKLKIE